MQKKRDVLTTGQVAQICNVAPRTVTKWFDSGQLKGYRIPGSRDRRIPTTELVRFMKVHHIPTDTLDTNQLRILIIDSDWQFSKKLSDAIEAKGGYEVTTARSSFDAGLMAQKTVPHVIMINLMALDIDAAGICRYVKTNDQLCATKIIAVANNLAQKEIEALRKKGFDEVLRDPADIPETIRLIQLLTSIIY